MIDYRNYKPRYVKDKHYATSLRMNKALADRIMQYSRAKEVSVSEAIRQCVEAGLDAKEMERA